MADLSHRKAEAKVQVVGKDGKPLCGTKVHIEQRNHEFLFGCGAFESLPYTNGPEVHNGNGSLMRIMPAVLYCLDHALPDGEAVDIVHKVGSLTHAHIRTNIACGLYYFMAAAILGGSGALSDRLQAGLNAHLSKPVDPEALFETLENLVK